MAIIEPPANDFEAEYRGRYQPEPVAHVGVIVEGSVGFLATLKGHPDDGTINTYDMRLLVGPYWRNVENCVPKVTIDGFYSSGPDVDNSMRWRVRDLGMSRALLKS